MGAEGSIWTTGAVPWIQTEQVVALAAPPPPILSTPWGPIPLETLMPSVGGLGGKQQGVGVSKENRKACTCELMPSDGVDSFDGWRYSPRTTGGEKEEAGGRDVWSTLGLE